MKLPTGDVAFAVVWVKDADGWIDPWLCSGSDEPLAISGHDLRFTVEGEKIHLRRVEKQAEKRGT